MKNWKEIHPDFTPELQKLWENNGFNCEECKEWINIGLQLSDVDFASWLKKWAYIPRWVFDYGNLEELRVEYQQGKRENWTDVIEVAKEVYPSSGKVCQPIWKTNSTLQEFLNNKYPTQQEKEQVKKISIPYQQSKKLIGNQLNLSNYPNLEEVWIDGRDLKFPLTELNLSGCGKLVELGCSDNQITNLNLNNCINLKKLCCSNNQFSSLNFLNGLNSEELTGLGIINNNLTSDLNSLRGLVNLERLDLSNNPLSGSLEPLQGMVKLKHLDIRDTGLDSGLEYLPESIKSFWCSANKKKDAKVKAIYNLFADEKGEVEINYYEIKNFPQKLQKIKQKIKQWKNLGFTSEEVWLWITAGAKLDDYKFVTWLRYIKKLGPEWITNYKEDYQILSERFKKYGLCPECNQPNTGDQWCQPCNIPRLQKDFNKWTSHNPQIDQFIQKYQLASTEANKLLEWIPYEQFSEIEYLAEGGFGKVYKARWAAGNIHHWDTKNNQWIRDKDEIKDSSSWNKKSKKNYRKIVLKILHNSQNNTNFLQETEKHKIIDDWFNNIVPCYGLSQDPNTGNYLMVMQYIKGGDLRKYLKTKKLSFKNKLLRLVNIAQGLKDIHQKNLVHRDFHSGNILNNDIHSFITDLGLCKPVSEANKTEDIYGVLPYVAPEVLRKEGYTPAADIYSWGIVAYEVISGKPPYYEYAHDSLLAFRVCEGLRPRFDVEIPTLLKNLIERCWDADPAKRPTANELNRILSSWLDEVDDQENTTEFFQQFKDREQFLNNLTSLGYKIHPSAFYTSRRLDFKNLPQPQNSKEINDLFWSNNNSAVHSVSLGLTCSMELENIEQDLANLTKRQLSLDSQAKTNQGEAKQQKIIEEQTYQSEPMTIDLSITNQNWTNLHPSFTPQLIQAWQNHNFTYQQTRDWINIHSPTDQLQAIQEPEYYAWLRDIKQVDNDWVLNHGNHQSLKQEYQAYQQQAQILHNPPTNS